MWWWLACVADGEDSGAEPVESEEWAFVAPDTEGTYGVSATTMDWTDARGQSLRAEVWYPVEACSAPEPYDEIPIEGGACRDLEPAVQGHPIVAFSHGFAGIRYQSIFLTEALARHGFVVVAVDHPRNTFLDLDMDASAEVALARPGDVVASVDELLRRSGEPGLLHGVTDDGARYAMTGHSFGGWTTLAVAGGVTDIDGLRQWCKTDPDNDLCSFADGFPEGATVEGAPDPRAVVGVPMAPGGWYSFGDTGLSTMAPTLVFAGDADSVETLAEEAEPLYDRLPTPKALAVLAGAEHYAFSDICLIGDLVPDCEEEAGGYIDLERAHAIVRELTIAWIQVQLRGDERYREWLTDRWEELTWEAED